MEYGVNESIRNTLDRMLKESPYADKTKNEHVVLLTNKAVSFVYKAFRNIKYECYNISENTLSLMLLEIRKDCEIKDTKYPNFLIEDITQLMKSRYSCFRKGKVYLVRYDNPGTIDLDEVFQSFDETDESNKYKFMLLHSKVFRNGGVEVFDFLNNYETELKRYEALCNEYSDENVSEQQPINFEESTNCVPMSEEELLDKIEKMIDNTDSYKIMMRLCKISDKIDKCMIEHHFDLSQVRTNYFKNKYVDDSCGFGYPIVKDLDDIPSPFPEEIEGESNLSNV